MNYFYNCFNLLKSEKKILLILVPVFIVLVFVGEKRFFEKRNERQLIKNLKNEVFLSDIALFSNRGLAKSFQKEVELNWSKNYDHVVYGNSIMGYFRVKGSNIKRVDSKIHFSIIPPTYRSKVEFYVTKGDLSIKIKEVKFMSNDSKILKNIRVQIKGKLSSNFFLLGGVYFPNKLISKKRGYFPIIINKLGELVWAHIPDSGKRNMRKYPVVKPLGNGEYGILFGEKWSYFEKFNSKGEVIEKLYPRDSKYEYVIHHDFIYNHSNHSILTFGHSLEYLNYYFVPRNGSKDLVNLFVKPLSFLSNPIIEVDLKSNDSHVIYDPVKDLGVLYGHKTIKKDGLLNLLKKTNAQHFTSWSKPDAKIDWLHANSMQVTDEGILISYRNINKLIMYSHDFNEVKWAMGSDKSDDFFVQNRMDRFYHQHHATLLPDKRILLLDNNSGPDKTHHRGSRVLILKRDFLLGTAAVDWEYTATKHLNIGNRGSVELLENGNILAFYPRSLLQKDHLIEVDYDTKRPVGHIAIYFATIKKKVTKNQLKWLRENKKKFNFSPITRGGGNRAVPIGTIGEEEFLGYEL